MCSVDECTKKVHCKGMCSKHYSRFVRYGDVHYVKVKQPPKGTSLTERFWSKVDKSNECWLWTATYGRKTGYGRFGVGNQVVKDAHVVSYELTYGPIPEGLEIDHKCRVRLCVRPDHLEAVTHSENMWRSPLFNGNKTHCVNGHEYTEENTAIHHGRRECRRCNADRAAEVRWAKSRSRA